LHASDLRRAVATAAPLAAALGLPITTDARLRERSLGILEGTTAVAVPPALSGVAGGYVVDPDAWPPDGESLRVLPAYLRGVPVERMSWEPVANGSVVRLASQPPRRFTRREQQ